MIDKILQFILDFAPLLLATLAGLISEFCGLLNIGIEGLMLVGAFLGIFAISSFGASYGVLLGIVLAILIGGFITFLISYLSLYKGGNIFILGLSINLLSAGVISILSSIYSGGKHTILLDSGNLISNDELKIFISIFIFLLNLFLVLFVKYTKTGMRLRILGSDTNFLDNLGVNTKILKMKIMFFSGGLACLAGLIMSIKLGAFVQNQSAGRGWIALVLVYAGGRSFIGVILASAIFVLVEYFVGIAQFGLEHPSITIGIPFLLSLFLIILQSFVKKMAVKYTNRIKKYN